MTGPSLHEQAALGDGVAFSQLAAVHYRNAECSDCVPEIELARAVVYARMAAIRTNERVDWVSFIFLLDRQATILRERGHSALADMAQGEAVALAEYMAIDGDDEMSAMIVNAADSLTPGTFRVAGQLSARANEALAKLGEVH